MITLVINLSKNILLQTICLLNVSYLLQIRITSHLCIWISVRYLEIELTYEQHGLELHRSPILSVFFFVFLTVVNTTELHGPVMIGWIHGCGMNTKGQL